MQFVLGPHIHMVLVEGDVVLLDAHADRYACLAAGDAGPVRTGYPERCWEHSPIARELADAGYLVPASAPRTLLPDVPPLPESDLYMLGGNRPEVTPYDFGLGAWTALGAAWQLAIERPKHWLRPSARCATDTDRAVSEARRFAEVHLYLPRLTRCLPHSLALIAFLERRDCPAKLIFGVRTHPFEAHCWVQAGTVVLNDTLSHVRWYTPIAWS